MPVDRIIDFENVRRKIALEFAHSGGGSRRNDNLKIWHSWFQGSDKLRAEVDFADAHRMDPQHVPVGDRLFDLGVVTAEPLTEILSPMAAPPQLHKVVGRAQQKKNREQNIV